MPFNRNAWLNHAAALASAGEFEGAGARYAELIPRMTESLA